MSPTVRNRQPCPENQVKMEKVFVCFPTKKRKSQRSGGDEC